MQAPGGAPSPLVCVALGIDTQEMLPFFPSSS